MTAARTRFTITAGALVRNRVRQELRKSAHLAGLTLRIEEERSWLGSMLICEVSGSGPSVDAWMRAVDEWSHA